MTAQIETFTIIVTPQQLKVISDALIQGPYCLVQPIISDINSQIYAQTQIAQGVVNANAS